MTMKLFTKAGFRTLTNADALNRIGSVGALGEQKEIPDDKMRKQILDEFHDSPVGGQRGMNKTNCTISAQYTWPKMRRKVEEYVKQCKSCQVNKILTSKHKALMQVTTTTERPFEKCYLDVVGPLPVTLQGCKYILTFQDDLSSSRSHRET